MGFVVDKVALGQVFLLVRGVARRWRVVWLTQAVEYKGR
jgi:hypothetical protein